MTHHAEKRINAETAEVAERFSRTECNTVDRADYCGELFHFYGTPRSLRALR